jgi:hypothetical protein
MRLLLLLLRLLRYDTGCALSSADSLWGCSYGCGSGSDPCGLDRAVRGGSGGASGACPTAAARDKLPVVGGGVLRCLRPPR